MTLSVMWLLLGVVGVCIHSLLLIDARLDEEAVKKRSHMDIETLIAASEVRLQRHLLLSASFFTMAGLLSLITISLGIDYADLVRRLLVVGCLFAGFTAVVYAGLRRKYDRRRYLRP